jgi:hypothetical protein
MTKKEDKKERYDRLDARLAWLEGSMDGRLDGIEEALTSINKQIETLSEHAVALGSLIKTAVEKPHNVNLQAATRRGRDRRP